MKGKILETVCYKIRDWINRVPFITHVGDITVLYNSSLRGELEGFKTIVCDHDGFIQSILPFAVSFDKNLVTNHLTYIESVEHYVLDYLKNIYVHGSEDSILENCYYKKMILLYGEMKGFPLEERKN